MISVMSSVGSPTDVNTITMVTRPAWGMPAAPMLAAVAVILCGWWEGWRGERKKIYKGKQTVHEELHNYTIISVTFNTDKLLSKSILTTCKNKMYVGALALLITRLIRWINCRKGEINISNLLLMIVNSMNWVCFVLDFGIVCFRPCLSRRMSAWPTCDRDPLHF